MNGPRGLLLALAFMSAVAAARQTVVWAPQPGPQEAFVTCDVEDVLFGGARFGGKTDALIGDFIIHAGRYGEDARGILFRRTFSPELEEVILRTKQLLLPLGWKYNETHHSWAAPNGATLLLRYLDADSDADLYQGHSYTWMGFDELGNWATPTAIDKLWACLRSTKGVPCVRRSTCNPGGPGHVWVRDRYRLSSATRQPFRPFEWSPLASRPDLRITSVFIPSLLEDNLYAANDPEYETRIAASSGGSEALFRAWRSGDWDVLAGAYFDQWSRQRHVQPHDALVGLLKPWSDRWASCDWGYAHEAIVQFHGWTGSQYVTYDELVFAETEAEEIGAAVVRAATGTKLSAFYLSPDAFARKQDERTIAIRLGEVLRTAGLPYPVPAVNDRVNGWRMLGSMLAADKWVISDRCQRLVERLPLLQRDPKHPEDVLKVEGDDAPDCARYGLMSRPRDVPTPTDVVIAERVARLDDPTMKAIQYRRLVAESRRSEAPVTWRRGRA